MYLKMWRERNVPSFCKEKVMKIKAYIEDGTWLRLSNNVEFRIPKKLARILMEKGIKIQYKYRKE